MSRTILAVIDHMQEHIFSPIFPFPLTFPWPVLNSLTFPGFPGKWPAWVNWTSDSETLISKPSLECYGNCVQSISNLFDWTRLWNSSIQWHTNRNSSYWLTYSITDTRLSKDVHNTDVYICFWIPYWPRM